MRQIPPALRLYLVEKFGGEGRFFGPSLKVEMKGFVIQGVWNDNGSRN
jgi:hypothetical protein